MYSCIVPFLILVLVATIDVLDLNFQAIVRYACVAISLCISCYNFSNNCKIEWRIKNLQKLLELQKTNKKDLNNNEIKYLLKIISQKKYKSLIFISVAEILSNISCLLVEHKDKSIKIYSNIIYFLPFLLNFIIGFIFEIYYVIDNFKNVIEDLTGEYSKVKNFLCFPCLFAWIIFRAFFNGIFFLILVKQFNLGFLIWYLKYFDIYHFYYKNEYEKFNFKFDEDVNEALETKKQFLNLLNKEEEYIGIEYRQYICKLYLFRNKFLTSSDDEKAWNNYGYLQKEFIERNLYYKNLEELFKNKSLLWFLFLITIIYILEIVLEFGLLLFILLKFDIQPFIIRSESPKMINIWNILNLIVSSISTFMCFLSFIKMIYHIFCLFKFRKYLNEREIEFTKVEGTDENKENRL